MRERGGDGLLGLSTYAMPSIGVPSWSVMRQPSRHTTGMPPRRFASAISDRVPQEPPMAITASADQTMTALRASLRLVTMTADRSGEAVDLSASGRTPDYEAPAGPYAPDDGGHDADAAIADDGHSPLGEQFTDPLGVALVLRECSRGDRMPRLDRQRRLLAAQTVSARVAG